jgi:uncharacterized protein YutE (UPF0331/DUF86 family)
MIDADVLARKLLVLNEALRELLRPAAGDATKLSSDAVLRAAVERWLQVALESCIDIAFRVVAAEGWTPPQSARASFLSLAAHGRLSLDLAQRLALAAALRNVLVHGYATVDVERIAKVVRDDLGDLRLFAAAAAQWLKP